MKLENLKDKKIIINGIVFALIIIGIVCFLIINNGKQNNNDSEKNVVKNTNQEVIKETLVEGIKIYDVQVKIVDGMTTYTAKATNTTDSDIELEGFAIIVKGKDINTELGIYGLGKIGAGETTELTNYSDIDLTNATSIEYKFVKELKTEENNEPVLENNEPISEENIINE